MPVQSMTGFGKHSLELRSKKYIIEIKSLNSKQLDLNLRIPTEFRPLEPNIRKIIASTLQRGKVDALIGVENTLEQLPFDENSLLRYVWYFKNLSENQKINSDPLLAALRMPDLFTSDSCLEFNENEISLIEKGIYQCLEWVLSFRQDEGRALKDEFQKNLNKIRQLLSIVDTFEQERTAQIRNKLLQNLNVLNDQISFDDNRFEQELIYYLEKMDFTEEKVRLASHLDYFEHTMDNEESCGRKLNFIAQEIGREINTLGAKANHAEIQRIVVQMKDQLEKIKEQVLNVL